MYAALLLCLLPCFGAEPAVDAATVKTPKTQTVSSGSGTVPHAPAGRAPQDEPIPQVAMESLHQPLTINEAEGEINPFEDLVMPKTNLSEQVFPRNEKGDTLFLPSRPVEVPFHLMGVMLGPVREANLLLPEKLDPFREQNQTPDEKKQAEELNIAKQQQFLGNSLAFRQDTPEEKAAWRWMVQAGGNFRQGSTSNTNMQASFLAERHSRRGDVLAKFGTSYNQNGDEDPNRRAYTEGLVDRNLRGNWIGYVKNEAEYDEVRKISFRDVGSFGLGYKFINRLKERWVVRTGPTLTYVDYFADSDLPEGTRSGWLLESDYRRALWESARLEWTISAFPDLTSAEVFRVRNEAAILFPIGGAQSRWNWKIGARQEYQIQPAEGTNSNDFEGYFSITYSR